MRGVIVLLLCLVMPNVCAGKKRIITNLFQLSDSCKRLYVNVHDYDEIDVKSMERGKAPHSASAGATCLAYFKTTNPGQGICIRMLGRMGVSDNVSLSIHTGPYGAEKIFRRDSRWRDNWCFPDSLVVVNISTTAYEENVDRAVMFSFSVTNVSLSDIQKRYYMDTFMECGLTHKLSAGQTVTLQAERKPRVTSDLPMTCDLTFETTAEAINEQLCLDLEVTSREDMGMLSKLTGAVFDKAIGALYDKVMPADQALTIRGLNGRFYSSKGALMGKTSCSANKELTLSLTRNMTHFINFRATLTSQRHPNWKVEEREAERQRELAEERRQQEEDEQEYLHGLGVVKGLTYLIACIDSLVGIGAAVLAVVLRKPQGPWKRWAEEFNAKAQAAAPIPSGTYPPQDPASYGSMHTCKDGNYPELPLEGATPTNEVLVETHTY